MEHESNPAENNPLDPLTSPAWLFESDDDILLAPKPEDFFSDLGTLKPQPAGTSEIEIPASAIVSDPDLVTSPAEALNQARKRIAAMRASLQLNLNQVAQSFNHPIFTPPESVAQPAVQPASDIVEETISTPSELKVNQAETVQSPPATPHEEIYVEPTRVFTPTDSEPQPETQMQSATPDHSLELMIMRDEIKDLRDRLDASQKLIEELMHRLANLAELALRR